MYQASNKKKKKSDYRQPFSEDCLNKLFSAPLFTGCMDDELNYKIAGSNHPRRHKFWIPLLALHTGMRLNEICQLFTDDIELIDDIYVIHVRLDEGGVKRLKNLTSERMVPVHPQLINIGFLEYVENTQKSGHKMLFPELSISSQGSYSDNFSKWFTRFLNSTGLKTKGYCFHSFRHNFRDALREANTPREIGASLGGWKISENVMDDYGKGFKLKTLNKSIESLSITPMKHLYR